MLTESTAILTAITNVKLQVENIQRDLREIKDKLLGSEINKFDENLLLYNISIPLNSIQDWNVFEDKLKDDLALKQNFVSNLKNIIY